MVDQSIVEGGFAFGLRNEPFVIGKCMGRKGTVSKGERIKWRLWPEGCPRGKRGFTSEDEV